MIALGRLSETAVSLRFFGPTLNPDELTNLLGCEPTKAVRAGDLRSTTPGRRFLEKNGSWRLVATRCKPGDLNEQITGLLDQLTPDLGVWLDLSSRYRADIFCGLFLGESNEGISVSSETALKIGQRGLKLDLDIYSND